MAETWHDGTSLAERVAAHYGHAMAEVVESRFAAWRASTPFQETAEIPDAAELYGMSDEEFKQVLAARPRSSGDRMSLPEWYLAVNDVFAGGGDVFIDRSNRPSKIDPLLAPLLAVADPFLVWFRRALQTSECESLARLPEMFEQHLELRFFQCLLPSLLVELHAQRMSGALSGETSEARYLDFCRSLHGKAARIAFFGRYPVLARQVMTLTSDAVAVAGEVAGRFMSDWGDLVRAQLVEGDSTLAGLSFAGDPHANGRTVLVITFASGRGLIYKPRPMAVEANFQLLLKDLNALQPDLDFREIRVIDKGSYGWAEFVLAQPASSIEGIQRFYRREGGLLALLHALAAVDFHAENVVASGEHPVLVDLETLFSADFELNLTDGDAIRQQEFFRSYAIDLPSRIGLLPGRRLARDDRPGIDVSGLGGISGQELPIRTIGLEAVGTDEMRIVLQSVETSFGENQPRLENTSLPVHDYVDDFVGGFRSTYSTIIQHRERWLKADGAIGRFEGNRVRILLRPTMQYTALLSSMAHPECTVDGLSFDFRLDRLLGSHPDWAGLAVIAGAERRELWRRDIPVFSTTVGSRDLRTSSGTVVSRFLATDGMTLVRERLERTDLRTIDALAWYVRASLECAHANSESEALGDIDRVRMSRTPAVDKDGSLERELLNEARVIAAWIEGLRLEPSDGVSWIGVTDTETASRLELMGYELYGGLSGMAFFLAYLGAATGEERWSDLAHRAIVTARRQFHYSHAGQRLGAFNGIGGYIYLLVHLFALWGDPALLDEAEACLESVALLIADDETYDVIGGSAGMILVLLALDQSRESSAARALARQGGERLLRRAERQVRGVGWIGADMGPMPLTGFGHGAAGIAYALFRLHAATGDRAFRDLAVEAILYERDVFDERSRDWPDLRERAADRARLPGWCHGAAGIGASRARISELWRDSQLTAEVRSAAGATCKEGFGITHSLCHGDLGNLDLLMTMAGVPQSGVSESQLRLRVRRVLEDVRLNGYKTGVAHGVDTPDLMRGAAGIGLGLLRLARPSSVPSVLLLDAPAPSQTASTPFKG